MRLLQMLSDIFGKVELKESVKAMFQEKRAEVKDDKVFFNRVIQYLGGRGYNEFLDYGLFALKLKELFGPIWWKVSDKDSGHPCKEALDRLLLDDRHDLWQNLPYYLEEIEGAYKTEEDKAAFYKKVVDALIECINVHGTGDRAYTFVIKE